MKISINSHSSIKIDNIYFDLEHDTNDAINAWFNFILDMADEQIYRATERLSTVSSEHLIGIPKISASELKKIWIEARTSFLFYYWKNNIRLKLLVKKSIKK